MSTDDPSDAGIELPDAPTEDGTERDGFASYAAEVHAIGHGLYDGMRYVRARPGELPDNSDVQAEPHYYKGAYVVGTLLQFALLVAVSKLAI